MITKTQELSEFCAVCAQHPYVTVDTEFMRERTYYSQLCLIQVAYPGEDAASAQLIDPLSDALDLEPLYELFEDESVIKVFHAARQDLEIFAVEADVIPYPFFDTQVAAMVCGFGDQVGYEKLVRKIARQSLDKSSRFTDWSRRPLSEKQQTYALADVTHLRQIYEYLEDALVKSNRKSWLEEELSLLTDPQTYQADPEESWLRIRTRNSSGRALAIIKELAKYREQTAQSRNIPRNRIMKDDAILELASTKPKSIEDLNKSRLLTREMRKEPVASAILKAIAKGMAYDKADLPVAKEQTVRKPGAQGVSELLRVLLKAKSEETGVAQKLIANAADLDLLAQEDDPDIDCLKGWRREVFGADALRLKNGEIALSADGAGVKLVEVTAL
jgi:ribonuclease D